MGMWIVSVIKISDSHFDAAVLFTFQIIDFANVKLSGVTGNTSKTKLVVIPYL